MQTVIRNISIAIPFVAIIEYIAMRRNINGQRLGDRFAKTKVNDLSPHLKDGRYLVLSLVAVILFSLLFSLLQPENTFASASSGINSENSIVEGSWSGFIESTKGELAKKIAAKTEVLSWTVAFDTKSQKMQEYSNSDGSTAATDTTEDYPEFKCMSDAIVVFDKYIQEFFNSGKNHFEPTHYTQMRESITSSNFYFSHAEEKGIVEAGEGRGNDGFVMIWDGKEFQEITLFGVSFVPKGASSILSAEQFIKMSPEQREELFNTLLYITTGE